MNKPIVMVNIRNYGWSWAKIWFIHWHSSQSGRYCNFFTKKPVYFPDLVILPPNKPIVRINIRNSGYSRPKIWINHCHCSES